MKTCKYNMESTGGMYSSVHIGETPHVVSILTSFCLFVCLVTLGSVVLSCRIVPFFILFLWFTLAVLDSREERSCCGSW